MRSPETPAAIPGATSFRFLIIGSGFAGLGMAIALRKAGIDDFAILEKAGDVGGVWRDNAYPGAACDVPSHLYSFSFEPNPRWSRVFAPQEEILEYLRHCARRYDLLRHVRLRSEVASAAWDESAQRWMVQLQGGQRLDAQFLVSGTGQLSRPALPAIAGIERFAGPSFHSARWDHGVDLAGKRVAVIGTGASAIQFVPAIAGRVEALHVFQRSPSHMMPRPDRAYSGLEKVLFGRVPGAMRLHRAWIYLKYESRALAFTRFKGLMQWAVGRPFRKMLERQVPDAALREALTPDYPIGCKRILLSSEYLATMARANVHVQTGAIDRVEPGGIRTRDGQLHAADVIVYGTGFAATQFLSPMKITGRGGRDLNAAWQRGAAAYLGITVPGFPNFFMLYGPNTNLGHNSIVYMIESQIAHVMRCLRAMERAGAATIEPDAQRFERYNRHIQQSLRRTVWNGCKSWYVDANGHNSTNWPGFTLSYRAATRWSGLDAYRLQSPQAGADATRIAPPPGVAENLSAALLRGFLRLGFKRLIGTPFGAGWQRAVVGLLSPLMPGARGTVQYREQWGGVPVQVVAPAVGEGRTHVLYLHGGAFCLGSPHTHRSITTRLALSAGAVVAVPDYRLAPEHPYPAALDDARACYQALLARGVAPGRIVLAGDSAGGALAMALLLSLKRAGQPMPAGALLISPVTDPALRGASLANLRAEDPMIREGWLRQGLAWYGAPATAGEHQPLAADLSGLPPVMIQVGEQEVLRDDSLRLADRLQQAGVECRLQVWQGRWHVFHLQSAWLRSAALAIGELGAFARERVRSAGGRGASIAQARSIATAPGGAGRQDACALP
ncbi:flavin-containing monooxygenase [Paracidovorax oryzae]|uniref:flavin-containing monooxygenase n=1 Tax=Paracidovorax oryzae TaxID=862720 RepID=UPI0035CFB65C